MKIAMVSEHASPLAVLGGVDAGGQNVHVAELSAALCGQGHEVTVYTRREDADAPDTVTAEQGYRVVHVPAGPARVLPKDELLPHMVEFGVFLREQWRDVRPDVVHAHFWMSGLAALSGARPTGVPVVQTFHALGVVKRRHQGADDTSPADRVRLERLIAEQTDRIIATCTDEVFELARFGVPRSRTSVIPCGVDLAQFTPDGPAEPKSAEHRMISVGRLVPRKGFDTAITALTSLRDTELVLVGGPDDAELADDPEGKRLLTLAEELGVRDRVHMLGRVPRTRIAPLLRSADVAVCTPWYEPFGMTPLEAMACGIPVVATAVGGLIDTVVDGVTGRLVPAREPAELADAVGDLLTTPGLRERCGRAGRERVEARYSWDRIATETLHAYHRVIASGARRGSGPTDGGAVDVAELPPEAPSTDHGVRASGQG
ncbi:glycosyltransferase [Nocardia sp. CDC186]|uniref:Glycosyltransferase n=1 Tax=Nocardia implantans TaxID=3108168 RepID=A0ABU6AXJ1_9NOCA|nr:MULTISPECIES: glycosyltransferase [unclassified Nocardia]MBF6193652.1 glycosyltransferase [Nocardia beijingensis]MEA3529610.1 glycosyltransferase [Nocardia sp. CDC192]MEB3512196.1 glycosyltransferase [Nocardia sp. CDC186]